MADEDYAILPTKEIKALKEEVEKLKKNPIAGTASGKDLLGSVDELNKSLNAMMEVFKEAAGELKMEDRDTQLIAHKINPIMEKLEEITEQNEKIAAGIVTIADMIKERLEKPKPIQRNIVMPRPARPMPPRPMAPMPRPMPAPIPPPRIEPPLPAGPVPGMGAPVEFKPGANMPLPPLPPRRERPAPKRGLFRR